MTRWIFPADPDPAKADAIASATGLHPALAGLLVARGADADLNRFLGSRLGMLTDPFLLPHMREAIGRLLLAVQRGERIVLYGDYDVDGVTSLALVWRMLRAAGADAHCFLPNRIDEGYGLSADAVARCLADLKPGLLIAMDCGTSSRTEIADILASGTDVLVFDHHEIKGPVPECPLVNPKLGDDFRYLCTAGLAFKLCHAFLKEQRVPGFDLKEYLDIVALGTVADIVPLLAENRILVKRGLEQLAHTRWEGLRALIEVSRATPPFAPSHVSFQLGPRLNAAGRLGTARAALDLLLTDDPDEAAALAEELDAQNRERRALEDRTVGDAAKQLAESFDPAADAAIVLGGDGWHPGVIGIVAGRFCRDFHRPALVVGFTGDGAGKGSGRSIDGFSLIRALADCAPHLETFGGHEMAAGLTIRKERFGDFREQFLDLAGDRLTGEMLEPCLHIDAVLPLGDVGLDFLQGLASLQPFGSANPAPVFCSRRVGVAGSPAVLKEKHLRLNLEQGHHRCQAIWFGAAAEHLPAPPWDVAYVVERNDFRGKVSAQVQIKAVRAATDPS